MATRRNPEETPARRRRPATTPEAKENQMIALAVELAEKQMRAGTASSQVISHYLKLGSSTEKLAQEKTRAENEFLRKKSELVDAGARQEALFAEALKAMRDYKGDDPVVIDIDDED